MTHDTEKWGPLLCTDKRRLVRLVDVVRFYMSRDDLPLRRAAGAVLDAIGPAPTIELFLLKPADYADALTAESVIPCLGPNVWWVDALSMAAAIPDCVGIAAVVAWVRPKWTEDATKSDDLDESPGGELALLACDAARLFGFGASAAVIQIAGIESAQLVAAKRPGDDWQDKHLSELLRQFVALTTGANAVKASAAHERIAVAWSIAANTVRTYLTKARGKAKSTSRRSAAN